jgi:hypothetical protein
MSVAATDPEHPRPVSAVIPWNQAALASGVRSAAFSSVMVKVPSGAGAAFRRGQSSQVRGSRLLLLLARHPLGRIQGFLTTLLGLQL